jgi:sugar-specific transcriptional regulator TrmB
MLKQERITRFLQDFGLNENEIRIYCLLSSSGPQKATTIAKSLRLQKMQVYRCLQDMENKGVVQIAFETPKRFAASSIENLLNEKTQEIQKKLVDLEANKKEILDQWKTGICKGGSEKTERFAVIQGEKKLAAAVDGLRKRAREELCTLITLKNLVNANLRGDHDKTMSGKVPFKYRVLTRIKDEKVPNSDLVLKRLSVSPNVEVRCIDAPLNPFPGFGLIDKSEVVLITQPADTDEDFSSLWTNNETIVGLIKNYFEELWRDSANMRTILK